MPNAYYRNAHGIMVFFDLTDMLSFSNVRQWLQEIERYASENLHVVLVGTKCDLKTKRVVSEEAVSEFMSLPERRECKSKRIAYVETSAKDNINVDLAFDVMAFEILRRRLRDCPTECDPAFVVDRERRWQRAIHLQCTPDVQERVKAVMCVWRVAGERSGLGMLPVEVVDLILVMAHDHEDAYAGADWEWDESLLTPQGERVPTGSSLVLARHNRKRKCAVC
eukprot:TRINITY_DN2014_c0_g1_i4.p1 TRINITY_DN2014_c0_g1~~TRINITY_DN2014_c0_g1_i4.p1  ORF type:complete len:223 (-),score=38.87 TRINITY_DN2014_c0_g1_i4:133-801(-)